MICPNIHLKEVKDGFNEMVEALGGRPLTEEEFKSSELRNQRTGLDYSAMEAAYRSYHRNNGNMLDKAPNGNDSVLFNSLLEYFGNRAEAIKAKANVYTDEFFNWFGDWTREDKNNVSKVVDENGEPRVMYHTTNLLGDPNFDKFDTNIRGFKSAIYSSDSLDMSASYLDPLEAEMALDAKWIEAPNIPFLIEKLSEDYPQEDWYNFDYNKLPLELLNNKYVRELNALLELNDIDADRVEHNLSIYKTKSYIEYEINKGDHLETIYKNIATVFTKLLYYNIKNPFVVDADYKNWNKIDSWQVFRHLTEKGEIKKQFQGKIDYLYYETKDGLERKNTVTTRDIERAIDGTDFDGVVIKNVRDYGSPTLFTPPNGVYIAYESNLVKHVKNLGEWSTEDNNIYHESFNQVNTSLFTKDSMLKQAYEDRIKDGKNMSIEEALNYISRTEVGASVISLINYISKSKGESLFPKDLAIRIVSGIAMPHTAGPKLKGHRACYDADTKTIYIDSDSSYENGDASNVLLHEIMHAITLHLLANNELARVKLQGVLDIYRKSYPDQYLNAESHSLEEFVADIWTNPTTISRLKNIPYKTESLFDRVINILKQLFKSFFKEDTLFAEASKTLVELLESTPPNRKGTAGIYYAAQPTNAQIQKEYDLISDKIRSLFSELYKRFDKMPNKSNTRRKTLTQIFKTIQHLKEELTDKAIEIALLTAAELLGVINQQTGASQSSDNLYAWFINLESKDIPYENVTPQQLLDIYKYQIGFYRSVLATIPDGASSLLNPTTRLNRQDILSLLDIIENFWKHAIEMVGEREIDNMIDSFTGLAIPLDQKENMKIVYRDWLHKNWFHGDINAFTRLFTSYGQSGNPIVKIAFHLTQYAEQKTQEELLATSTPLLENFQAVNTAASWTKPGWQKIFQEINRDGIPTGKWVRDINYGQYEQDLDEFVKELNEDFDTRYGYHYIYDDLGMPKNSVTGVYAEDEEWTNGILPTYVEYLLEMYRWKCSYANLPYTFEYYSERLSRPYDEVNYQEGHGLSLKTLQQYQNLLDVINYYLGLCTGEDGIPHPELPKSEGGLTTAERMGLDKAKDDLYRLSSPFEDDGTPKVDEEYQTAMEILTWQKYISDKQHGTNIDYASFAQAEAEAKNQATLKNDPSILYNFYKYNSEVKIDPDFLEAIFGQNENKSSADIIIKQIHQKCLERLSKIDNNVYSRDIEPFKNNVEFWMMYRLIVQDVSDGKQYRNIEKPDLEFEDVAEYCSIVYTDPNGNTYDVFGNVATSATPTSDLMTWFGYMVNHYKDIAIANNGTIPGVNDLYGNPVVFYGSDMQIYDQVKDALFTYERTWFDKLGLMHTQRDPLPLFTVLLPKDRSLIQNVPTGRFSKPLYNPFENSQFDKNAGISEQPKRLFYDNSEAYNKVMKDKNVKKLYLSCIQVMQDMQKVMGFNNKTFNYKLPMLNADTSALFSRGDFKSILKSVYEVQNDDSDMRNLDGAIKKLDGTIDFDIPLRLLYDLKDMKNLTSDVVLSVILYVQMAYNYRNKKAIQDTMLTIHDNLTPEVRNRIATDYDRFNGTNMDAAIDDEESLKQYEAMMDSTMYGLDTGKLSKAHKEATKGTIAARKIGNATVRMEALATLGLNLLSMFAGGFDSITKMLRESLLNRYMSFVDLIKSFGYVLLYLPKVIMNWGNPLPNCKIVGAMQLNSVSKDYTHIFDNLNHNRLIRTANRLLMGGFSMFDYFSNMIMLRAHYRNVRFYDGDVIPKGFYTAYEMRLAFKQAGMSWLEGSLAHSMCKNSLWSAYEFKDHKFVVRDEYISKEEAEKAAAGGVGLKWSDFVTDKVKTDIRTKSQQRSALYNGMAPDNDRAAYLKAIWGKVIFAMRNWYQMVLQRNLVGTDDTSVRKVVNTDGERIKYGKAVFKPGKKVEGITEEQSANRMGWNFETNAPLEEIWKATARSAWKLLRMGWALLHLQLGKVKNIKLSNVEKYAIRGIFTQILIILLLYHAFIPIMLSTKKIVMPTNKLEAELSVSNLLDNLSDLPTLWFANATIRSYESNVAELSVVEPKNFVKTPSALFGVFDKLIALWMMAQEGLGMSSHTLDETINSGSKYKYFTRGERYLWQASGIGNNLMTSLTIQGVKYNTQWYMNMYGDSFRRDGYEFSIGAKSRNASGGHKLKRSGSSKKLKRTKPSKKLRR